MSKQLIAQYTKGLKEGTLGEHLTMTPKWNQELRYQREAQVLADILVEEEGYIGEINVLDVGCGAGNVLDYIKGIDKYIGIDIVDGLICKAKEKYIDKGVLDRYILQGTRGREKDNGVKNIRGNFVCNSVFERPVEEQYFLVMSCSVVTHMDSLVMEAFVLELFKRSNRYVMIEAHSPEHYAGKFHAHAVGAMLRLAACSGFEPKRLMKPEAPDSTYVLAFRKVK